MSDKRVTYYANGPDNWIRRDWAKQCAGEVFMGTGRCQGMINHEGSCWAYSPAGCSKQTRRIHLRFLLGMRRTSLRLTCRTNATSTNTTIQW